MNKGYIIILNILLMSAVLSVIIFGAVTPIISAHSSAISFIKSKQAFLLSDSAAEEGIYRLKNNKTINSPLSITLSSSTASVTITNTSLGKDVVVTTPGNTFQRNIRISLALGTGVAFHYGIQSGRGGFDLNNSSSVRGNVYSSGPITGTGNYIYGDVISSGATGLIDDVHATGTAYAHSITDSIIDKDAYYHTNKTGTTVGGTSYPNSPDQGDVALPISDEQIAEWEAEADAGTDASCTGGTYTLTSSITIGPLMVPCDFRIRNDPIITIAGPIWVKGNITTANTPTIKMSAGLGSNNVAIIADNPANRTTSSRIILGNSTSFEGSGSPGSFVFMISQNNSAENGGSVEAISVGNSSTALVGYASHGLISLSNNVGLKEVTAYKIVLNNSASVTYDTGLANSLFSEGPGGDYTRLDWQEF